MIRELDKRKNERALVLRLIAGDEEAFCELYADYKNRLIYFAMRFIRNREYAEDIFQDAFATVWQTRRSIDPEQPFGNYLYTIVKNRMMNELRTREQQEKWKEQMKEEAKHTTDETRESILLHDLQQRIDAAIQQLTARQRQIFTLSREKQLTHREIAQQLGISVNTVQESISTSLHSLRRYLENSETRHVDIFLLLACLNLTGTH